MPSLAKPEEGLTGQLGLWAVERNDFYASLINQGIKIVNSPNSGSTNEHHSRFKIADGRQQTSASVNDRPRYLWRLNPAHAQCRIGPEAVGAALFRLSYDVQA